MAYHSTHRGQQINRLAGHYVVPGARWGPGIPDVPRFLTLQAARDFIDRRAGHAAPTALAGRLRANPSRRKAKAKPRRNPAKKRPARSHDLFGERESQADLFGGKVYVPEPKAAPKGRDSKGAKARPGQMGLDIGGTMGMF